MPLGSMLGFEKLQDCIGDFRRRETIASNLCIPIRIMALSDRILQRIFLENVLMMNDDLVEFCSNSYRSGIIWSL